MAHGPGPGADHHLGIAPAALDDDEGVEQLGFPIGASARFAPSECRQRRDHRPHVFWVVDHLAEARLHAPQRQHDVAVDAVIVFNAGQQRGMLLRPRLAGDDPPVRNAAVEVLPQLFVELRLGSDLPIDRRVGLDRQDPRIGRLRNPARQRPRAERVAPLLERAMRALRCGRARQGRGGAGQNSTGERGARSLQEGAPAGGRSVVAKGHGGLAPGLRAFSWPRAFKLRLLCRGRPAGPTLRAELGATWRRLFCGHGGTRAGKVRG
jgi:hypothetical protein